MREILIMWSAYARPATCPYSLWGGGGSPEAARQREGNAIICWRKIAQGFWSTSVFFFGGKSHDHRRFEKRGFFKSLSPFIDTIARQCRSFFFLISNTYKWKGKVRVTKFALFSLGRRASPV